MNGDHKVGIVGILCVTGLLAWGIFNLRGCDISREQRLVTKISESEGTNQTLAAQLEECRLLFEGTK